MVDTTLLRRVRETGLADLLPFLFTRVVVPKTVKEELGSQGWRKRLRALMREAKGFLEPCPVETDPVVTSEYVAGGLDAGEAEAIAQADELKAVVLIDEVAGRGVAETLELDTLTTGDVLLELKQAGAIEAVAPFLDKLQELGFWLKATHRTAILAAAGEEERAVPTRRTHRRTHRGRGGSPRGR